MNSEIAFFVNENSGSGQAKKEARLAAHALPGLRVSANLPRSAIDLSTKCGALDSSQTKAAVVFGGDGTQTYALRGLIESGIPLYPFPVGTANDLASEQGITGCFEQMEALIQNDAIEEIRVLGVNGIPFSTVAGIGIGADLCAEYNRLRNNLKLFKKASQRMNCEIYSVLAAKQILQNWGKGLRLRIQGDHFDRVLTTSVVMICNQSTLAGNLKVAPGQVKNAEEFTVLLHPEACGFGTLKGLGEMKLGRINDSFISFKTRKLKIENLGGEPLPVFGDGEILTAGQSLEFKSYPKKLKIYKA
jgi:diacylglycerol kinase family enzyme